MTAIAPNTDNLRLEAARLAVALLRFDEGSAHLLRASTPPGALRLGTDAYGFLPSWRNIPRDQVEPFLLGLPSAALLAPTTIRGVIALILLHELSGDRRRWFEKAVSNFAATLAELSAQLGLSSGSRVLLEFDNESHVFSFAAVCEWSQQFPVQVAWSIWPLEGDSRADARIMIRRSDGGWFRGRSCMEPSNNTPPEPSIGAA